MLPTIISLALTDSSRAAVFLSDLFLCQLLHFHDLTDLINDDISDDVDCANIVFARHGFDAWYGWLNHCENTDTESYVSDCGL